MACNECEMNEYYKYLEECRNSSPLAVLIVMYVVVCCVSGYVRNTDTQRRVGSEYEPSDPICSGTDVNSAFEWINKLTDVRYHSAILVLLAPQRVSVFAFKPPRGWIS